MLRLLAIAIIALVAHTQSMSAHQADTLIIKNGERAIFGILNRLDNNADNPLPLAIIAHGFNGDHRYGMNYFETLARAGYQCYTLDFPCGSTHSMLDSNTVNMSIRDQQSDLEAVINYFAQCPYVNKDRIILIGESQGGLVSSLTASALPDKVYKLVLAFPAFCIPDHHNGKFGTVKDIPDTTYVWRVPLGKKYFTELRSIDAYTVMPRYTRPVLIVHGDKDPIVPLSYSEKAVTTFPDARLKVIKDAGHGFKNDDFTLSTRYITEFLSESPRHLLQQQFLNPAQEHNRL